MIKLFGLILRLAGKINSQFFNDVDVHLRKYNRGMHFAAAQFRKLFHCKHCGGAGDRADRQRNQNFVRVKSGDIVAEVMGL